VPTVLWSSFLLVVLAEMCDKTQLLAPHPRLALWAAVDGPGWARGMARSNSPAPAGEMGDKRQLATVALGARFGTTLGMLAADGLPFSAAPCSPGDYPCIICAGRPRPCSGSSACSPSSLRCARA